MTREIKKKILRTCFALEIVVFATVYVLGSQGVWHWHRLQRDIDTIDADIMALRADVAGLEKTILAWHEHSFYKEKIAREQLQMAHADDMVYYVAS